MNSAYVAYRGAVPFGAVVENEIFQKDVAVHVGPRCHFVQYPLRGRRDVQPGRRLRITQGPGRHRGLGTPDELDAGFEGKCSPIQKGLPLMWRDRWWRMFDRDPSMSWVTGRIALLGDAAHRPLQYMAQGAIMAIEDGWVLAEHVGRQAARRTGHSLGVGWDAALAAYEAVRPEHCRRVVETARDWGGLWHLDGEKCEQCDPAGADHLRLLIRGRIFGPTALTPEQEPEP